jgi:Flp pilus assembly pilin Flp
LGVLCEGLTRGDFPIFNQNLPVAFLSDFSPARRRLRLGSNSQGSKRRPARFSHDLNYPVIHCAIIPPLQDKDGETGAASASAELRASNRRKRVQGELLMMFKFPRKVGEAFVRRKSGATAIEYALICALIAIVFIGFLSQRGAGSDALLIDVGSILK